MAMRYLTAKLAQQIDEELMSAAGAFSIDQLMELAGLACAQTLAKVYPRDTHRRVLVCCGPGNQGGDGLVAARHLSQFGYDPTIYMPKPGNKDIYQRLQVQCGNMRIPIHPPPTSLESLLLTADVILDAIFGFSFHPPARAPFDTALALIASAQRRGTPVVSVDIPSGWDVEKGPIPIVPLVESVDDAKKAIEQRGTDEGGGKGWLEPDVLISLTAPKLGAKEYKGKHFLGGRFVPKTLDEKFDLNVPEYPGYEQIVDISQDSGHRLKL